LQGADAVDIVPPRAADSGGIAASIREHQGMADVGGIAADRLRSFIERIERLEEEKAALAADIREVYAEAKGTGFDTKIMRQIVKLRKMDAASRQEQDELLDLYKRAIGLEQ
jgi:uncharacterized protein (UPF0335 family)